MSTGHGQVVRPYHASGISDRQTIEEANYQKIDYYEKHRQKFFHFAFLSGWAARAPRCVKFHLIAPDQ